MKRQFVSPRAVGVAARLDDARTIGLHAEHLTDPARERQGEVAGPTIEVEHAVLLVRRGEIEHGLDQSTVSIRVHLRESSLALEDEVAVDLQVDDRLAERATPALAEEDDAADSRVGAQKPLMVGVVVAKRALRIADENDASVPRRGDLEPAHRRRHPPQPLSRQVEMSVDRVIRDLATGDLDQPMRPVLVKAEALLSVHAQREPMPVGPLRRREDPTDVERGTVEPADARQRLP